MPGLESPFTVGRSAMPEPTGPEGPPVDVVGIMKDIRESIQKKREQGLYTSLRWL